MLKPIEHHISFAAIALCGVLLLSLPAHTQAQAANPCGPGKALYKDVKAKLLASGIDLKAKDTDCVTYRSIDTSLLSGGCENETVAKEFLKTRTANKASINGLNPEFACKLMNIIKDAPGKITISVGTYTIKASVATHGLDYCKRFQCAEGTNTHPLGCAADLEYQGVKIRTPQACQADTSCAFAHREAEGRGLQYRLMPGHPRFPGFTEPWHIELKDGDLTRCQGGQVTPTLSSNLGTAPLGGAVGNVLRNLLAPQTMPQTVTPIVSQPLTTSQSPATAFSVPTPVSQTIAEPGTTNTSGTSVADKLESLARGGQQTSSGAPTALAPIVVSAGDVKTVASSQQTKTVTDTHTGASPVQQTFTTQDLAWKPTVQTNVRWQQLESLRVLLVKMQSALTPFRGFQPRSLENQ